MGNSTAEWLPSEEDKAYIHSLMRPVVEPESLLIDCTAATRHQRAGCHMDYVQGEPLGGVDFCQGQVHKPAKSTPFTIENAPD